MKRPRLPLLWIFVAFELVVLVSLSIASGYEVQPAGTFVNLDIATMLTPWGLVKNLVLDPVSPLRRFYAKIPQRQGLADSPAILLLVLSAVGGAIVLLYLLRAREGKSQK